jgi:parallel beta-helix repeat protein
VHIIPEIDRGPPESRGRKEPKLLKGAVVALIFAVLFAAPLSLLSNPFYEIPPSPISARTVYSSHVPISIDGNAQFDNTIYPSNGVVSGNGTASNPYIIEGWDTDAASAIGVFIQNTDAYSIVRDCYVHGGGSSNYGICLYTVSNCIVSNNNCSNNDNGIFLYSSSDDTLSNNICSNNACGISLSSSNDNTLINNTCSNNGYGMALSSSSYNTLSNNTCSSNNDYGMNLYYSSGNNVSNNTCNSNLQYGIRLYISSDNPLNKNNCSSNNVCGISLYSSSYNTLSNNTCSNSQFGIWLRSSSDNNIITKNQVCNNTGYGAYIYSGSNNMIWNNTFFNPSITQAYDYGTNNRWNTSGSPHGYGNYWSDLTTPDANFDGIVDWSYNLTGGAGAKDYYPLTTPSIPPPIPEFSDLVVPIAGLMLISLIFGRTRKKP